MKNVYIILVLTFIIVSNACGQLSSELAKVRSELEIIYADDQTDRNKLSQFPPSSEETKDLWEKIDKKDSVNLVKVVSILERYGWLGIDDVGKLGNSALFLVIQHSDLATQMKYLPLMEEAVKAGKASLPNYALLKDRVLIRSGAKQLYGSQISQDIKTGLKYVLPIDDVENLDKRRAEVGLPPMKDYLKNFNMSWSIMQYENDLAAIQSKDATTKP